MVLFIAAAVAFLLALFPVIHHLCFGLRERRREILSLLDDGAIRLYFDQFYHAVAGKLGEDPQAELGRIYDQRFGLRTYVLPVILYATAMAVAVSVICAGVGAKLSLGLLGVPITATGAYALAGAYLWVVNDLISRYRLRNLVPSALYAATFRVALRSRSQPRLRSCSKPTSARRSGLCSVCFRPTRCFSSSAVKSAKN